MHEHTSSRWSDGTTGDGAGCAPHFPAPVIALHCSGADGGQWRKLPAVLGPRYEVFTPSFIGCPEIGPWTGERAFTLADEARAVIGLVDVLAAPVHLVGHSYGGAVALKVASARPSAVASLTLYEPSAFHLLRQVGARGHGAAAEIEAVASAIGAGLVSGAYQAAAAHFVDYWNGAGAWAALRPGVRDALIRWLPKAPLDFRALIEDTTPIASYGRIACPVHIIRGQYARGPSRLIADVLARALPRATLDVLPGAGHMGPVTHPTDVYACIAGYIRAATNANPPADHARPVAA
jgi:pimeloyl-ACP methyl ester carboxylesterase